MTNDYSLIPPHLAVESMRDSGYKNAAHAIAELMDNAIQAEADTVELLCVERQNQAGQRTSWQIERLAVSDNGKGMDADTVRMALQFGNGTRLNDRTGIGRFGMGLPNASISQCRRVEVWTWQNGPDSAIYTYIDLDEVVAGTYTQIPEPTGSGLPSEWRKCMHTIGESGTLVVWSKLDRIMWRTAKTLIRHSEHLIGRMYRYFLHNNEVEIRLTHFAEHALGSPGEYERWALPNDPSYLLVPSSAPSPYDQEPMFQPFGNPIDATVKMGGSTHTVRIEFAYAEEGARKVANGKNPGDTVYGRHAAHNVGVSLVRERRELMLDGAWANEQPTERWWGVTVHIPASLDEVFGVTNNKQAALNFTEAAHPGHGELHEDKPLAERIEELRSENDPFAIVLEVSKNVQKGIRDMRRYLERQTKGTRSEQKSRGGSDPAAARATEETRKRQQQGHSGRSDAEENNAPDRRREVLAHYMVDEGVGPDDADKLAGRIVDSGLKYTFMATSLESPAFFTVRPSAGTIQVRVNRDHPAYKYLFELFEEEDIDDTEDLQKLKSRLTNAYSGLKLLLMAWARYEDEQEGESRHYAQEVRSQWGMIARRFLSG